MTTDTVLGQAVSRFLRYLGVERQLSPITLLNYQRQLDAIIELAEGMGLQNWQQCDAAMVRSFATRSRRKGLGAASLALRLSALRSFFDWMVSQGVLPANPAKGIAAPKAPRHLPKNIDVDDVNRLLDIDLNDPLAVRDRAMLEVMYGAGLRLSELVNLDIKHLDLDTGEVWVMGKGSKERRLPIGRNAVVWIEHWLDLRGLFGIATCIRTSCATRSPPICLSRAAICAACRNCWGTPTSRPPKSIPILIFNTLLRCTMRRIRAPNGRNNAFLSTAGQDCRVDV